MYAQARGEKASREKDEGNGEQTGEGQWDVIANEHATGIQNCHDSQWPFDHESGERLKASRLTGKSGVLFGCDSN